jgi:putative DNA primase/helicase
MNPADHRKELTAQIIRQLEAGTAPWVKPWLPGQVHPGMPFNAVSNRPYHGGNLVWLDAQGYNDPRWCTFKQAAEQGWQVRKGEKSTVVEYWQWMEQKRDDHGQLLDVKLETPRVFYAAVFNVSQMDHVPGYQAVPPTWSPEFAAENIIAKSGARILHSERDKAYYHPRRDSINLPPRAQFKSAMAYYGTLLHELGHWTGHESRLNRDLMNRFGSEEYAREELRAELASYILSTRIGIPHDPGQHTAYIGSWIEALKQDHNEIFRAAKDAEHITEYVMQFQHERVQQGKLIAERQHEEELVC